MKVCAIIDSFLFEGIKLIIGDDKGFKIISGETIVTNTPALEEADCALIYKQGLNNKVKIN